MFIGHNAVGFASKQAAPRVSLGMLMAVPMLPAGVEQMRVELSDTRFTPLDFYDCPWSHRPLMACVRGVLFGGGLPLSVWSFDKHREARD